MHEMSVRALSRHVVYMTANCLGQCTAGVTPNVAYDMLDYLSEVNACDCPLSTSALQRYTRERFIVDTRVANNEQEETSEHCSGYQSLKYSLRP